MDDNFHIVIFTKLLLFSNIRSYTGLFYCITLSVTTLSIKQIYILIKVLNKLEGGGKLSHVTQNIMKRVLTIIIVI